MKISKYFNLGKSQYELDFVDIDIATDVPLFLDPYFLGTCGYPWAESANRTLYNFFQRLLTFLKSDQIDKARDHFSHLTEPNETCLGLSQSKPQGRGVGTTDTNKIFDSLLRSKAIESGIVEDIEDCRIFVRGIDKDKLSDMTTNIIRKHLIEYTQAQCDLWGIPLQDNVPSGYMWDRLTNSWENVYTRMLVIGGRKILLVPKSIVSYSVDYTPQRYIQHFVLNFLQHENLKLNTALVRVRQDKHGNVVKRFVTKKSIRDDIGHISKDYLAEFTASHPEIFKNFKDKTAENAHPFSNEEMATELLSKVILHLSDALKAIRPGNEEATKYHRTIVGILELIFYPRLTSPKIEKEIHDGRKRIDITFDNSAESGFFFRLANSYGVPSPFILVECKNYARDVANPELDQIAGRFNPNRGKFGIIICRSINDINLFLRRCSDTYRDDRGLILPLIDNDLLLMLTNYEDKGIDFCEEILVNRFRHIALT